MESLEAIRANLTKAQSAQKVLAAGREAFDLIRQVATERARIHPGAYPTWMSVIPPACEGRDALGRAPSIPPGQERQAAPGNYATDEQAARDVARLAEILTHRLQTGDIAHNTADQQAIERAVLAAIEILELLAGED
jgi:hypothetical protein